MGESVLATGAASGIGRAATGRLLDAGCEATALVHWGALR